ncbi:hypothetical protein NC652_019841 [Populus alba x Populus x berolinensis]|nr:hypothetical protein NC652_019841 [Populus alba x Populus x berolinensis]
MIFLPYSLIVIALKFLLSTFMYIYCL